MLKAIWLRLLVAEILDDVVLCLVQLNAMKLVFIIAEMRLELLPYGNDYDFAGCHFAFEKRDVQVEIAVIQFR